MQYGIAFTPLVPAIVLWIALAAIVVIAALLLLGRSRGAAVRVAALALILLALANPSFTREEREPLSSVAAVVIDKSPSQGFGERARETEHGDLVDGDGEVIRPELGKALDERAVGGCGVAQSCGCFGDVDGAVELGDLE
jgi:hypothetical protein